MVSKESRRLVLPRTYCSIRDGEKIEAFTEMSEHLKKELSNLDTT
jgi:hypothetical protein